MQDWSEQKRFSQACENNKRPILAHLQKHLGASKKLLEIGSGTGQHAAFLALNLPHIVWQPTDVEENHQSILAWVDEAKCNNVLPPCCYFIGKNEWQFSAVDVVFSANTAHIMQANEVQLMMQTVANELPTHGQFCQYGPFKIDGQFTSDSNRDFDFQLRQQGYGGIRRLDELVNWGKGLELVENYYLPANNQLLIWKKI